MQMVASGQSSQEFHPGSLLAYTAYYWQVIAKDDQDHETSSPVWTFVTAEVINMPPNQPATPAPRNEEIDLPLATTLTWTCSDPEGDDLTYDVYFGTEEIPPLVSEDQIEESYTPDLEIETTYYWMIIARADEGEESPSPVWSFTTIPNLPPTIPLPEQDDASLDIDIGLTLSWTCTDPEGDSIRYDIYLSDFPDPELVSEGQADMTYQPENLLKGGTTYYWKIVAIDDSDNITESPIWTFTTVWEYEFQLGSSESTISMVWIPDGTFMMGAIDGEYDAGYDETPRHEVTISEGFWMGKYELTQLQWEAVTGERDFTWPGNPDRPAEAISHDDIMRDFLPELGDEWRLPTEAEWEYACRAGEDDDWFWWGSAYEYLDYHGWYYDNSDDETHDVGGKDPNPWGLYDMHGNVWEWCSDWYYSYYYESSPSVDPTGPENGAIRIARGGGWSFDASFCRSANRGYYNPSYRSSLIGLRLVRLGDSRSYF